MSKIKIVTEKQSFSGTKLPLKHLLPSGYRWKVDCIIEDSYTGFVNAIRSVIVGELTIQSFTTERDYIQTNDKKLDTHDIIRLIQCIPISQDIDFHNMKIGIDVENKTNVVKRVTASDIYGIPDNTITSNMYLLSLDPGKYLKIKIILSSGINRFNAAAYSAVSNIRYWVGDEYKDGVTLYTEYTWFKLGYTTYFNAVKDPLYYIKEAINNIIERLSKLEKLLKQKNTVDIKIEGGSLFIYDEREFIASLLAQTIYILHRDIEYVTRNNLQKSRIMSVISVKGGDVEKLTLEAIAYCVDKYNKLLKCIK